MPEIIVKIAVTIGVTCVMAALAIMIALPIRKSSKISFILLLIAIILGAVITLPQMSFIQIIETLALCADIVWFVLHATAPLGRILVDIWEEEDKLDAKLKGNHYERHD